MVVIDSGMCVVVEYCVARRSSFLTRAFFVAVGWCELKLSVINFVLRLFS